MAQMSTKHFRRDLLPQPRTLKQRRRRARIIRLRGQLHDAFHHYQQTSERLSELRQGAQPDWANEAESCWSSLAETLDDWRDIETAYCAAAGLETPYGIN